MATAPILTLTKSKAIEFINFVSESTNYDISSEGECVYSKKKALEFVNSDKYNPEKSIYVCFETRIGNTECASVYFFRNRWRIHDHSMGGLSASGDSIKNALNTFYIAHDRMADYCPVELVIKRPT